jgi:hypothetical protein
MLPIVTSKPRDYGLSRTAGARLSFFFHADQIPGADGATPAAFPSVGGFLNQSQSAPPTVSVTGFNGQRALNLGASQHLQCDAFAQAISNSSNDVWVVLALVIPSAASTTVLACANSSTATPEWAWYHNSAAPTLYVSPTAGGGAQTGGGSVIAYNATPIIYGLTRRSGVLTIKILSAGGETTMVSSAVLAPAGACSLQRASLGAQPTIGSPTGYSAFMPCTIRACGAGVNGGPVGDSQLTDLMVHFRDKLGCAL